MDRLETSLEEKAKMLKSTPSRLCNEFVDVISTDHLDQVKAAAALKIAELLDILRIDHRNDSNMKETPQRVASMLIDELLVGRFSLPPEITEFENKFSVNELIVIGPIEVRSMCAHHMMPIYGSAFVGVLPNPDGRIAGLSKFDRAVHYFSARLQVQEELVTQIGQFLAEKTNPRGLAVRISAVHMCRTHRGVRGSHDGKMITNYYCGAMLEDHALRVEFQQHCLSLGRSS